MVGAATEVSALVDGQKGNRAAVNTSELSWRDKLAIVDTTIRIALLFLLLVIGICGVSVRGMP
jgi:hypothetical protein